MRVIASTWATDECFLTGVASQIITRLGMEAVLFRWDTRGKSRKRHERRPDGSTFFFPQIKSWGLNRHRTFDKASITERRYTGAITIGAFFLISFLLGIAIALGFRLPQIPANIGWSKPRFLLIMGAWSWSDVLNTEISHWLLNGMECFHRYFLFDTFPCSR